MLWACAVDLTFQNPTALRAFDLRTGALRASYQLPDRGVCTDIALAHGDVYITDTTDPTAGTPRGRILRLTTPRSKRPTGASWRPGPPTRCSPARRHPPVPLVIPDQRDRLRRHLDPLHDEPQHRRAAAGAIGRDGSAAPATVIDLDRDLVVPDGIRMLDPARLLVTELVGRLTLVNVHTGTTAVVSDSLDQPTSLVRVRGSLWLTEAKRCDW